MDHPLDNDSTTDNKNNPLTPQPQQQQQEPLHVSYPHSHPREEDDNNWHQYTTLRSGGSPNNPTRIPSNYSQSNPQRYESLTGLLLQSGTSPSFGIEADDESYKMDDGGSMDLDDAPYTRRKGRRCRFMGCSCRYDSPFAIVLGILGIGALGTILGFIFPSSSSSSEHHESSTTSTSQWDIISNLLGYTYFLSWTLSFYPQIIANWLHPTKAKRGVSLDFVVWNVVGFACYAIYTTSFRYSDVVRREYAERFGGGHQNDSDNGDDSLMGNNGTAFINEVEISNPFGWSWGDNNNSTTDDGTSSSNTKAGSNATNTTGDGGSSNSNNAPIAVPQVKVNDVAFAWHALLLTIITFVQIVWCSSSNSGRGRNKDHRNNEEWIEVEGGRGGDESMVGHVARHENFSLSDDFVSGSGSPMNNNHGNSLENDNLVGGDDLGHNLQQTRDIEQEVAMPTTRQSDVPCRISSTTSCLILLLLVMCVTGAIMVACNVNVGYWGGGDIWQWIDYLYFLSFVKVGVSIVKYIPQVLLNYQRKSTSGWQIWNILLDFSGGTLSIVQLVGDSIAEAQALGLPHSWTGIVGNPAKFGLGIVSIFFDVIFMFQHYVLYRHSPSSRHRSDERGEVLGSSDYETPLLHDQ